MSTSPARAEATAAASGPRTAPANALGTLHARLDARPEISPDEQVFRKSPVSPHAGVRVDVREVAAPVPRLANGAHTNVLGQVPARTEDDVAKMTTEPVKTPAEPVKTEAPPRAGDRELLVRVQQVIARLADTPATSRLRVTAPGTGEIDVTVSKEAAGVRVTVQAATPVGRDALERIRGHVVEAMRREGVPVVEVEVASPPPEVRTANGRRTHPSHAAKVRRGDAPEPPVAARAPRPDGGTARRGADGAERSEGAARPVGEGAVSGARLSDVGLRPAVAAADAVAAGTGAVETGAGSVARAAPAPPTATLSAPLRPAAMAHAMTSLVVRASAEGSTEARLVLDPPELGHVRLRIAERDGQLRLTFEVQSHAARESLVSAQPHLQDLLERQGLKVAAFSVDLGAGGRDASGGSDAGHRQASAPALGALGGAEDESDDVTRSPLGRVDVVA